MNKTKLFAGCSLISAIGCGAFCGMAFARKRKLDFVIYASGVLAGASLFGITMRKLRRSV